MAGLLDILGSVASGANTAFAQNEISRLAREKRERERKEREFALGFEAAKAGGPQSFMDYLESDPVGEPPGFPREQLISNTRTELDDLALEKREADLRLAVDNEPDPIKADDLITNADVGADVKRSVRGTLRQRIDRDRVAQGKAVLPSPTVLDNLSSISTPTGKAVLPSGGVSGSMYSAMGGPLRYQSTGQQIAEGRKVFAEGQTDIQLVADTLEAINRNPELANGTLAGQGKRLFEKLTEQNARDQARADAQFAKRLDLEAFKEKELFKKELAPPPQRYKDIPTLLALNDQVDVLVKMISLPEIAEQLGPVSGLYEETLGWVTGGGSMSEEMNELRTRLYDLVDQHLRARSGAAVPETEVERVMTYVLGGVRTDPKALMTRLKTFKAINNTLIKRLDEGYVPFIDRSGVTAEEAAEFAVSALERESDAVLDYSNMDDEEIKQRAWNGDEEALKIFRSRRL